MLPNQGRGQGGSQQIDVRAWVSSLTTSPSFLLFSPPSFPSFPPTCFLSCFPRQPPSSFPPFLPSFSPFLPFSPSFSFPSSFLFPLPSIFFFLHFPPPFSPFFRLSTSPLAYFFIPFHLSLTQPLPTTFPSFLRRLLFLTTFLSSSPPPFLPILCVFSPPPGPILLVPMSNNALAE